MGIEPGGEAKATLADEIGEHVLVALIKPARRRGGKSVTFTALDAHRGMGPQENRVPVICEAPDAQKFLDYASVTLQRREGPAQSTTATWTFTI